MPIPREFFLVIYRAACDLFCLTSLWRLWYWLVMCASILPQPIQALYLR